MAKTFKLNWVPLLLMLLLLWLNHSFVFVRFDSFTKGYLAKLLCVNVVIFTLLANASYYSNRAKIERRFILLSFLSFIFLTSILISIGILFKNQSNELLSLYYWLTTGRFVFFLGFTSISVNPKVIKQFESVKRLFFGAVFIVLIQWLIFVAWQSLLDSSSIVLFLFDVASSGILLLAFINAIAQTSLFDRLNSLVAVGIFFIGQLIFTILPHEMKSLLQGFVVIAFGAIYLFVYLNRLNSTLPALENENLKRQFNLYAKNLKKIIDKKTIQLTQINDKFIEELEYAKKIQQSLLPKTHVKFRDINIYSGYFPCEQVSGDFYDVYRIDDDNLALYILDVAGHGISAALMTMFCNNYLKSNEEHLMRFRGLKPDFNLQQFYHEFNQMHFPDEMHMVMFYATLNLNNKMLTYCSGGMNCIPIHIKPDGKYKFLDKSKGFSICKIDKTYTPEFVSARVSVEKGDRIVFYTDGLIDEEKNHLFTPESFIEFLVSNKSESLENLNQKLSNKIGQNKDELNDDVTFLIMEI